MTGGTPTCTHQPPPIFFSARRLSTFVTTLLSLEQTSRGASEPGAAAAGGGSDSGQRQEVNITEAHQYCDETVQIPSGSGRFQGPIDHDGDRAFPSNPVPSCRRLDGPVEGEEDDARVVLGLMTMEQVREERKKRRIS